MEIGVVPEHILKLSLRSFALTLLKINQTPIEISTGMRWFRFDHNGKSAHCAIPIAFLPQCHAEVEMCSDKTKAMLDCLPVVVDRFIESTGDCVGISSPQPCLGSAVVE